MADEISEKRKAAALKHNLLLFAVSMTGLLGLGWGGMTFFGYYWIIVDLAAAPGWSVIAAFVAMPVLTLFVGFVVGDGSIIEIVIKTITVGVFGWVASGRFDWFDPFLLATGCGLAAALFVGAASRALGLKEMPDDGEDVTDDPPPSGD